MASLWCATYLNANTSTSRIRRIIDTSLSSLPLKEKKKEKMWESMNKMVIILLYIISLRARSRSNSIIKNILMFSFGNWLSTLPQMGQTRIYNRIKFIEKKRLIFFLCFSIIIHRLTSPNVSHSDSLFLRASSTFRIKTPLESINFCAITFFGPKRSSRP